MGPTSSGTRYALSSARKVYIQRDYSGGLSVKFTPRVPPELEGRLESGVVEATVERLNLLYAGGREGRRSLGGGVPAGLLHLLRRPSLHHSPVRPGTPTHRRLPPAAERSHLRSGAVSSSPTPSSAACASSRSPSSTSPLPSPSLPSPPVPLPSTRLSPSVPIPDRPEAYLSLSPITGIRKLLANRARLETISPLQSLSGFVVLTFPRFLRYA